MTLSTSSTQREGAGGCGTGTMKAKLVQQLAFTEQCPLFGIFINLQKAYDAMDWERGVDILRKAGVGPKALWLIILFWERAQLICKVGGYFGRLQSQAQRHPQLKMIFS